MAGKLKDDGQVDRWGDRWMGDGWMMGGRVDDEGWMDGETDDRWMMD